MPQVFTSQRITIPQTTIIIEQECKNRYTVSILRDKIEKCIGYVTLFPDKRTYNAVSSTYNVCLSRNNLEDAAKSLAIEVINKLL